MDIAEKKENDLRVENAGNDRLAKRSVKPFERPDPEIYEQKYAWQEKMGVVENKKPQLGPEGDALMSLFIADDVTISLAGMKRYIIRKTKAIEDKQQYRRMRDAIAEHSAITFVETLPVPDSSMVEGNRTISEDKLNQAKKDIFLVLEHYLKTSANIARKSPTLKTDYSKIN